MVLRKDKVEIGNSGSERMAMKSPSSKWLSLLLRVAFIGLVITLTLSIRAAAQDRPQLTTCDLPAAFASPFVQAKS